MAGPGGPERIFKTPIPRSSGDQGGPFVTGQLRPTALVHRIALAYPNHGRMWVTTICGYTLTRPEVHEELPEGLRLCRKQGGCFGPDPESEGA